MSDKPAIKISGELSIACIRLSQVWYDKSGKVHVCETNHYNPANYRIGTGTISKLEKRKGE